MDFSTDNSQISSFSGFSTQEDSDSSVHTVDFSLPSSVRTSELSDFQSDSDSDISSPEERDPNSDVDGSYDTDEDIFPDSEDDFNSQNGEITDSQLSEASATPEADFWSEDLEDVEIPDFDEESGPVHMLPLNATPFQFFSLFFENTFVDYIVEQTNLYAEQSGANPRYWEPVSTCI